MKGKSLTAVVVAVAAAMICIVAILAVKLNDSGNKIPVESDMSDLFSESIETENTLPVYQESSYPSFTYNSQSIFSHTFSEASTAPTVENTMPTAIESSSTASSEAATVTAAPTSTVTEKITELATVINSAFSEVFTLPKAPKYIPPESKINYESVNLASYRYNGEGNFYYTDDKDCWQKNFGFNEVYDNLAPISVMYYDTVRTIFQYGGKEWMIQMWKGQYGMVFVGGEVGVYTRSIGSSGTHFVCADKEDWLNMEMAFMWDENSNGNYKPIFNRKYEKYWWCTGFVVGFPNGSLRQTLKEFRLVHHITFKDTAMANAFCEAFEANGFTRVAVLDNDVPDTFVQVGADVAFVWQNINQK